MLFSYDGRAAGTVTASSGCTYSYSFQAKGKPYAGTFTDHRRRNDCQGGIKQMGQPLTIAYKTDAPEQNRPNPTWLLPAVFWATAIVMGGLSYSLKDGSEPLVS